MQSGQSVAPKLQGNTIYHLNNNVPQMTSQGRRGRKQRRGQGRKVAPVSEMASAYKSIKSSEKAE